MGWQSVVIVLIGLCRALAFEQDEVVFRRVAPFREDLQDEWRAPPQFASNFVHSPFGSSWRRDVSSAEEDGDGGADALSSPSSAVYQYFRPSTTDGEENGPVGFDASMDSTKPRFLAGTWSECSASCGAGIRSRLVECVAIQGVTADTIKLPDYECDGQTKPTLFQPCQLRACLTDGTGFQLTNSLDEPDVERLVGAHTKQNVSELADTSNMKEFVGAPELAADSSAYRWEYDDWGACSAYCLGGKQKSLAKCVDAAHNRTVARTHCDVAGLQRPADLTRSCNQQACPPAWETSEFSECSHSCGGGIRTRRVRCTRTVARASSFVGAPSTLLLPEAQCPAPKPKEQQPCGIVDCEPEWKLSKWSQCSTSCGAGEQRRTAVCQQRDALGTVHIVQPTVDDNASAAATQQPRCGSVQRPPTIRLCDLGSCADFNLPIVDGPQFALPLRQNDVEQVPLVRHNHRPRDNSHGDADSAFDNDDGEDSADEAAERWNVENSFDQSHPKHRKLTLDVGGIANLYEGTSLKVKCPVRNFRRDAIHWTRNGNRIVNNAHTKVSTNGALRIFHARMEDAGFYECFAGSNDAVGNVTLHFKRHHDDTTAAEKGRKSKVKIGNRTSPKSQMNTEILQKVKENLYRAAEFRVLDALNTVSDPSRVGVEFHAGEWSACGADTPAADDECRAFARRPASSTKRPIQVRLLTCRLRVSHLVAKVDEEICESLGAARPPSTRPCTQAQPPTHCPRWTVGDWAACSESRCVVSGTAIQRRDVTCAYGNGTLVADATRCDRKARPKFKRECVNPNCMAEWRTSAWGKCSKTCGDGGVQMRLLRCVWHGTRKPAGRNCDATRRPIAVRMCDVASLQLSKCPSAGARLLDEDNNTSKFGGNSSTTKSEHISHSPHFHLSTPETSQTVSADASPSPSPTKLSPTLQSSPTLLLYSSPTNGLSFPTAETFAFNGSATSSVMDYATWKRIREAGEPQRDSLLPRTVTGDRLKPGLERWRGWRLYNWEPPAALRRRFADGRPSAERWASA